MVIEIIKTEKLYISDGWVIYIIYEKNLRGDDLAICYLNHESYGPLEFMFGVLERAYTHDDIISMCLVDIDDYIESYINSYFDEEDF